MIVVYSYRISSQHLSRQQLTARSIEVNRYPDGN